MVRTYSKTNLSLDIATIDVEDGRVLEHRRIVVRSRQHAIHRIAGFECDSPHARLSNDVARRRLHWPKPTDRLVDRSRNQAQILSNTIKHSRPQRQRV